MRAKGFQTPEILRVFAAEYIALAIDQQYAEVRGARRVPAIFDFRNVHHLAGNLQSERTFVAFESGIALNAHNKLPDGLPASAAVGEFSVPRRAQEDNDGG